MGTQNVIKLILAGENRLGSMFATAGGQVNQFAGQVGYMNDSVADVTAPLASLAGGVLKVDAALAALAAGGLAYAFAKSKDFESASIELKKVLGDHPAALAEAETYARSLSGTYGEASTEILRSTANFKQAGFDIEESMQLTKNALDLVIAGDIEAAQASDLLVASLKGFKAPAEDAGRLIDILNEVSNNYATDVEQLAIGMAEISPIASTMGFSMEETAGVLTPVIEIFRSGGEAAVALKTGLLRMVDDNPTVVSALESIGVSQTNANGALRSGKDILADVAGAFTTLGQNEKLFVAQQLVGIQQSARMVTVFDNLSKTSEITAVAMGAAGSAALEVAARLESSEVSVNLFIQGMVNAFTSMGDQFRDSAKDSIDGATEIINALDSVVSSGGLDPLFVALESQLSALGSFLSQVAENIPAAFDDLDFSKLLTSLKDLGIEVEGLFDGLDLSTPEGLSAALQKVVDGVTGLTNVTSGMVSGAGPFIQMLVEMVDAFIEMDSEGQRTIGTVTGFGGVLNKLTGPVDAVLKGIGGIGTGMQVLAGVQVVNLISKLAGAGGLTGALGSVVGKLAPILSMLAGPAGVVAVLGLSATAVAGAVKGYVEWQDAEDELEKSLQRGADASANLAEKYRNISEVTGITITSTQDLRDSVAEGTIHFDEATQSWKSGAGPLRDYAAEVKAASEASYDWGEQIKRITDDNGNLIGVVNATTTAVDEQKQGVIEARAAWFELQGMSSELALSAAKMEGMDAPIKKVAKEAETATEKTKDFMLGMEKLAADERIKGMDIAFNLNTAALEADTDKAIANIENIGVSVTSTGDLINNMFGQLSSHAGSSRRLIEEQIEDENDRRRVAFEDTHQAADDLHELNKLRMDRMRSGEPMISVTMDSSFEPELRSIWQKILENAQVEMSAEQAQFLVGSG